MDYSDLWKAIHLVTLKARFMIEKQTDFSNGMDFIRTVRKAKLREFLTPVAKYCKAENIVPLVEHFLLWKEHFVEKMKRTLLSLTLKKYLEHLC